MNHKDPGSLLEKSLSQNMTHRIIHPDSWHSLRWAAETFGQMVSNEIH